MVICKKVFPPPKEKKIPLECNILHYWKFFKNHYLLIVKKYFVYFNMKDKYISYYLPAGVSGISPIDSHSVLTLQPMIDSQFVTQCETESSIEDSDVFQCGKCKKQFNSIDFFMTHKKECSNPLANTIVDTAVPANVSTIPQNTLVVRKIQLPSSSLSGYPQSLLLTDADLLQLSAAAGLDPNISTALTSCPNIQITTTNNALMSQPSYNCQTLTATIQQVIPHITAGEHHQQSQQQHIELSVLDEKMISRPIIMTNQANSTLSGLVLNVPSSQPKDTLDVESDVGGGGVIVEPVVDENVEPTPAEVDNGGEMGKEASTVNIIAEFHSSMVRTNKKTNDFENVDPQNKKDTKLNCAYCWKSFNKNFDLQQHIRCHTGEKPFQCIVCGRAFAQKSNVKKHMQTHKVWPDGLSRTLPAALQRSHNSASSSDEGEANSCSEASDNRHENGGVGDKGGEEVNGTSYACPYCIYIGKSYYKLKSHLKQHDTKKVYKCILNTCGLMFMDLDPFLEHAKSHENEMTYRCHECNKNFPSLYDLGAHQYTHSLYPNQRSRSTRRFFRCTLCKNKYSTPAALNHHMATSTHTYSCYSCNKVFSCERYLRRHIQIHSCAESFTCNLCGKGFKTENYLKIHMLVHSDEKPFACHECKAAFNRKDKLKRHLLIHEPEKRYKCPFKTRSGCPKAFNRHDKLKAHILTHSCVKPFACKICSMNFMRRTHLRDHMTTHAQEGVVQSEGKDEGEADNTMADGGYELGTDDKVAFVIKDKDLSFRLRRGNKRVGGGGKRRGRPRKCVAIDENSADSVSETIDDIPTAHIEIISANEDLAHISLPSHMGYSDLHFETITHVAPPSDQAVSDSSNMCPASLHDTNSVIFSNSLQTVSLSSEYS